MYSKASRNNVVKHTTLIPFSSSFHRCLVVVSTFWTLAIVPVVVNAMGNLFSDIMSTFDASRTEASMVQSVLVGATLTLGRLHFYMGSLEKIIQVLYPRPVQLNSHFGKGGACFNILRNTVSVFPADSVCGISFTILSMLIGTDDCVRVVFVWKETTEFGGNTNARPSENITM